MIQKYATLQESLKGLKEQLATALYICMVQDKSFKDQKMIAYRTSYIKNLLARCCETRKKIDEMADQVDIKDCALCLNDQAG